MIRIGYLRHRVSVLKTSVGVIFLISGGYQLCAMSYSLYRWVFGLTEYFYQTKTMTIVYVSLILLVRFLTGVSGLYVGLRWTKVSRMKIGLGGRHDKR